MSNTGRIHIALTRQKGLSAIVGCLCSCYCDCIHIANSNPGHLAHIIVDIIVVGGGIIVDVVALVFCDEYYDEYPLVVFSQNIA